MAYKKEEVVRGLDKPFASNSFTVRITKMEKTRSAAGNSMVTADIEVVEPQFVMSGSDKVQTAGLTGRLFGMLDPSNPLGLAKMVGALERAGLNPQEVQELNDDEVFEADDPEKLRAFVGKTMRITLSCRPRVSMQYPTPEEKASGKKPMPLKDSQGKDITSGNVLDCDWGNVTGPGGESDGF